MGRTRKFYSDEEKREYQRNYYRVNAECKRWIPILEVIKIVRGNPRANESTLLTLIDEQYRILERKNNVN